MQTEPETVNQIILEICRIGPMRKPFDYRDALTWIAHEATVDSLIVETVNSGQEMNIESLGRAAYEAVVRVTSNIVARCNKYGVWVALSMFENQTLDEAAKQMHIFASLLEKLDRDGYLNGDDVMMSVRARGYAHAVGEIAEEFGRHDHEEVRRLVQELDK